MLPFDELQALRNTPYYRQKGLRLYLDFKTFGDCRRIARAHAIDFYRAAAQRWPSGPLRIYEVGIGNASHALHFLEELKALDAALAFRATYTLCDISGKLLRAGQQKLSRAGFAAPALAGSAETLDLRGAHYIRSLEMLDDLPAKIFVNTEQGVQEVRFSKNGAAGGLRPCREPRAEPFMRRMPLGYRLPVNGLALDCLQRWQKALVPGGWIDLIDYGFAGVREITDYPADLWNENIVREYGTQLTVDVNFMWLQACLPRLQLLPQKSYLESVLGERLHYVELDQLDYLSDRELKERKTELKQHGYESDFFSHAEEKDDYHHARLPR